jgi:hypothetical protein
MENKSQSIHVSNDIKYNPNVMSNRRTGKTKARSKTKTQRAPLNNNKITIKLQALLDKYNRAYELVQKKMVECEKDLKQLDEYMKREVRAKAEYDAYADRYRAILEGYGTTF